MICDDTDVDVPLIAGCHNQSDETQDDQTLELPKLCSLKHACSPTVVKVTVSNLRLLAPSRYSKCTTG